MSDSETRGMLTRDEIARPLERLRRHREGLGTATAYFRAIRLQR